MQLDMNNLPPEARAELLRQLLGITGPVSAKDLAAAVSAQGIEVKKAPARQEREPNFVETTVIGWLLAGHGGPTQEMVATILDGMGDAGSLTASLAADVGGREKRIRVVIHHEENAAASMTESAIAKIGKAESASAVEALVKKYTDTSWRVAESVAAEALARIGAAAKARIAAFTSASPAPAPESIPAL